GECGCCAWHGKSKIDQEFSGMKAQTDDMRNSDTGGLKLEREHRGRVATDPKDKKQKKAGEYFKALPEIWALMRPRRGLLGLGLLLMIVNRVSGLVLPASTKFLVDDVIGKKHLQMLYPLVGMVLGATLIQGATSYALTQTLSKAAQKLIT